jgi:hypothetical protein
MKRIKNRTVPDINKLYELDQEANSAIELEEFSLVGASSKNSKENVSIFIYKENQLTKQETICQGIKVSFFYKGLESHEASRCYQIYTSV